ncbi:regulator of macrolide 2'-phosphotransferase I [Escherichia coli]|nr:regulator of macrolide 2'-phosphotransferase I [Escherichia coli]
MPRPKLKSDARYSGGRHRSAEALRSHRVHAQRSSKGGGLSRAALIQRFTNRDTLLVRMMERGVEQVRHYLNAIPIGAGPQGLWEFLQVLVRSHEHSQRLLGELFISWYELQVPELRTLANPAEPRGGGGDPQRLPPGAPAAAELLLHSVIAGARAGPSIRMVSS